MELSIVLPTYKEKENLSVLVPQIESAFGGLSGEAGFEIIVVDDGSKDGTAELLGDFNKRFGNVRLINVAAYTASVLRFATDTTRRGANSFYLRMPICLLDPKI